MKAGGEVGRIAGSGNGTWLPPRPSEGPTTSAFSSMIAPAGAQLKNL